MKYIIIMAFLLVSSVGLTLDKKKYTKNRMLVPLDVITNLTDQYNPPSVKILSQKWNKWGTLYSVIQISVLASNTQCTLKKSEEIVYTLVANDQAIKELKLFAIGYEQESGCNGSEEFNTINVNIPLILDLKSDGKIDEILTLGTIKIKNSTKKNKQVNLKLDM